MNRPPLGVADLVRAAGRTFIERSRKWITWQHLKVLRAIARCRTATLGGHLDECTDCGYRPAISYNSCRNRHCPKCQANARDRWLQARRKELLPTRYVHVVFTLPHELAPLALQNKKILYDLLLQTSAETLLEVARDPQHLGAEIGFFSVLHTWNQKLEHHPHAHCVVPAGGLSLDHSCWVPLHSRFFLPIPVLRKVFRRKFVSALKRNFRQGKLGFHGTLKPLAHPKAFSAWLRTLYRHPWHAYSKRPFGGAQQALRYLGRYTHRLAISNHRLVSFVDDQVTFRWRDRAHNNQEKLLPLSLDVFLRRFLLHVLPKGFVRIRHFGFLANRRRATILPLCLQLLGAVQPSQTEPETSPAREPSPLWLCPKCGGRMVIIERLTAAQIQLRVALVIVQELVVAQHGAGGKSPVGAGTIRVQGGIPRLVEVGVGTFVNAAVRRPDMLLCEYPSRKLRTDRGSSVRSKLLIRRRVSNRCGEVPTGTLGTEVVGLSGL